MQLGFWIQSQSCAIDGLTSPFFSERHSMHGSSTSAVSSSANAIMFSLSFSSFS